MLVSPSGKQFEINRHDQRATIVEVGGGIRAYTVAGRDVLQPYDLDAMCDGAHGAPLIPWPNRLADGRYRFDGTEQQLPLSEPKTRTAIHGLLRWRSWQAVEQSHDRVVMATRLHPLPGYPFTLDVRIDYSLAGDGLTVRTTATNLGDTACPYGFGQHPYLSPGTGTIDGCILQFAAATRVLTDPDRQLPVGTEPVAGTRFDFRAGRPLGDIEIDDPFTDLERDAEGRAWVRLTGNDGRTVALWSEDNHPVLQLYTAHTLAPPRRRLGLASEPMTCPPNAFRTGDHRLRLEPDQAVTTTWGVGLR